MITNITKENDLIEALDKSEFNDAIVFYDETHDKIPKSYHWNVNYVKINDDFISALKQVKDILRETESCEFFIEPNKVGIHLMYEILCNDADYSTYILYNGKFKLLPPQKNRLNKHQIMILKTLKDNPYTAAEIIRKSKITRTIVYDGLKKLQDMDLIVKSERKYELSSLGFDFLELL